MIKFLDLAGLTALWNKIKSTFYTKTLIDNIVEKYHGHDYSKEYLTFEAIEDGTFSFSKNDLQYSIDNGSTWTTLSAGTSTPTISAGNKIMWKLTGLTPGTSLPLVGIGTFSATESFNAYGNIMSLYYGDNFIGQTNLNGKNYAFAILFRLNTYLLDAKNLILPAETLSLGCYYWMFIECSNLYSAPKLPATILKSGCYERMFSGCSTLETAPELPANMLNQYCYNQMFENCISLTTAPELPATSLYKYCYQNMFKGCSSLVKAPELPATELAIGCYINMFSGCTELTKAPELPSNTLAQSCYSTMFYNCSSLIIPPELPATTLAPSCYNQMFGNCTSLTKAPELPATVLVDTCYYYMFAGCNSLKYVKCLATNIYASQCTTNWLMYVSPVGTFVKSSSTLWIIGNSSGIPNNWNIYTKDYTLVDSVSHTFVKNVTTSAGEKGEPQLRMWIDDYGYRSEMANEYGYSDWDSFLDGYVFGSHEDNDYAGANPFTYYGQTITLDGETYYLWEYDYLSDENANFAYLITDTVDYDDLNAISLASNYSNSTCPYVAVLDSDMEIYRTPSNDENDDVLVMITEL